MNSRTTRRKFLRQTLTRRDSPFSVGLWWRPGQLSGRGKYSSGDVYFQSRVYIATDLNDDKGSIRNFVSPRQ
ncbi:hypothetical protein E2C01_018728 [Portunus trituberculatus]|uniref:Uncharacterized protein n=1 Tax=Portunus trituberculatus TaxID=210409 RepID=A0A5B7DW14_PORTR|nr:hypothetical protein [Portunus trituberculatus]